MKQEAAHRARIALVAVSLLGLVPAAYGASSPHANMQLKKVDATAPNTSETEWTLTGIGKNDRK